MIWIASLIGIAVFFVWFQWWGAKPVIHKDSEGPDMEKFFRLLLSEGHEGAVLFIEPMTAVDPKPFVQFAKYGTGQGGGIRLAFPNAAWTRPYFLAVKTGLSEAGFPVIVESTDVDTVPEFAVLNFGNNLAQAERANEIVFSALGFANETKYRVWGQGTFSPQKEPRQ